MQFDLVFEGGGAKGMVFVGALQAFEEEGHTHGRLLGTSAGAITAVLLAAGYTADELLEALSEEQSDGEPVFTAFLGPPPLPTKEEIEASQLRELLAEIDIPGVPDFMERYLESFLLSLLRRPGNPSHLYALLERGGWFVADAFVVWLRHRLNSGEWRGETRSFGDCTLEEFHERTGCFASFVASDTTSRSLMVLNHITAPKMPVAYAVRASMGLPLVWPELTWRAEWGPYLGRDVTGHLVVDGGLLSNFAIELLVSEAPAVVKLMGPPQSEAGVVGFLIDEKLPVPGQPEEPHAQPGIGDIHAVERAGRLILTMLEAHDKMVIESLRHRVVRLPAKGYSTTEFGLRGERRQHLVDAGRVVTERFLESADRLAAEGLSFGIKDTTRTDAIAASMLGIPVT